MPLAEDRRKQLDDIVVKMTQNREPEQNVQAVVNDFKSKYEEQEQPESTLPPQLSFLSKIGEAGDKLKTGLEETGKGFFKGIGSTAFNTGKLLEKTASKITGQETLTKAITGKEITEKPESLEPEGTLQKVGFGVEKIAEFLTPTPIGKFGAIARGAKAVSTLPKVIKGAVGVGTRAVSEATEFGGKTLLQTGDIDDAKTTAILAGSLPIVGTAIKTGAKKVLPHLLSYTADISPKVFDELIKNTVKVSKAIKGKVTPEKTLATAQGAVRKFRTSLSKEWRAGTDAIKNEFAGQNFSFTPRIKNLVKKVSDDFTAFEKPRNMFNTQSQNALSVYKNINELFSKRAVRESAQGINVRALRDEMRKFMINNFGGEKGSMATLLKNYSSKIDVLNAADDIVKAYTTGKPISQATATGRLQAIFNDNKTAYLDAVLQLEKETGVDIVSKVVAGKLKPVLPSTKSVVTAGGGLKATKGVVERALQILALPLTSPRFSKFLIEKSSTPSKSSVGKRLFGS
jgi:hypothetical protein